MAGFYTMSFSVDVSAWSTQGNMYYSGILASNPFPVSVGDSAVFGSSGSITFMANMAINATGGVNFRITSPAKTAKSGDCNIFLIGILD